VFFKVLTNKITVCCVGDKW